MEADFQLSPRVIVTGTENIASKYLWNNSRFLIEKKCVLLLNSEKNTYFIENHKICLYVAYGLL